MYLQKEGDVNGGIPKSGQRNDCVIPVDDNVHFIAQNEMQIILMKEIKNQITLNSFSPEFYFDLWCTLHVQFCLLAFFIKDNTVNY